MPCNGRDALKAVVSVVAIVRASSTRDDASESRELLTSPVGRPAQADDRARIGVSVLSKAGCCARMTARVRRQRTNSGRATSAPVKFTSAAPL